MGLGSGLRVFEKESSIIPAFFWPQDESSCGKRGRLTSAQRELQDNLLILDWLSAGVIAGHYTGFMYGRMYM